MKLRLRTRLLFTFLVLVVVVGGLTMNWLRGALADDLVDALEARLASQGGAVAGWLDAYGDPAGMAPRLAAVTGTRITIVGADGTVLGDSGDSADVGKPLPEAPEVVEARSRSTGSAVRALGEGQPQQFLVAVQASAGRVIRLAVPFGDILDTRARMRHRLFVGGIIGMFGAIVLSWIFVRAITRPLQSMTRTAERLARGEYDTAPPLAATEAGGEFGVLAHAMTHMAGEVKTRIGELTEQRDLLSAVVGALVEGVIVVEPGGELALVNETAQQLVGEAGEGSALPPALVPLVARAQKGEPVDQEMELFGRTVRVAARPLVAAGAIVVIYDVTRMRALEAVRREFLSNAAHELRTPITSISGYAETLLGSPVDAAMSREFIQTIHRNARRIAGLVDDLMVLDQLGGRATAVGERAPIPLAQVVGDAARTAKGVTPAAQIDVDVAPDLAVLATRDGLDHVIQNLIDNAIKYGGGTPVQVSAMRTFRTDPGDGTVRPNRASRPERRIQLAIADSGPGIPEGQEDRVFERFYRVDAGRSRDQGGSGLGLAIVKSQVEAMGGRVWVEHGKPGARFVIELDAA